MGMSEWVDMGVSFIMNLSEREIMNTSVSISLNEISIVGYINISICMNLLMNPNGSKNMNMCMSMSKRMYECVCEPEWKYELENESECPWVTGWVWDCVRAGTWVWVRMRL